MWPRGWDSISLWSGGAVIREMFLTADLGQIEWEMVVMIWRLETNESL